MKTYRGQVQVSYWMEITVDAENEDQARQYMYEKFRLDDAFCETDMFDFEEIQGEPA